MSTDMHAHELIRSLDLRVKALESGNRPTPHPEEGRCPDTLADQRCYLWEGHPDQHVTFPTVLKWGWVDVEPCSHEWEDSIDVRTCRRCYITEAAPEPVPEPVPEWREWVYAQAQEIVGSRATPLENVFTCLAEVERGATRNYALARIIAVCESQVGDGWQADPDEIAGTAAGSDLSVGALCKYLGDRGGNDYRWCLTGIVASAWLRDLTEATP